MDPRRLKELPVGAVCTVSEAVPTGWNNPAFLPAAQVTVVKHTTVEVTVVNSRTVTPPPTPVQTASLTAGQGEQPTVDQLVKAGHTITYNLTATAGGTLSQSNVAVS